MVCCSVSGCFCMQSHCAYCSRLVFTVPRTTEIYTLSLHDALPIYRPAVAHRPLVAQLRGHGAAEQAPPFGRGIERGVDRKSTRLNSSHTVISYAVFCLKKKIKKREVPVQNLLF